MLKRGSDVVGASVLLVLLAPVIAVVALVSAVTYGSWPFFSQLRVGRDGRVFRLVKVRTLDPATPPSLPKEDLEAHRPGAACRFLRAHHLDELPQLLNVVSGSMSLVGPRPELVDLQGLLPVAFARRRTEVRPGLTGLWQVSRGVEQMIFEHPEYDEYYVAGRSLRLDLWILGRTATGLLGRAPIESLAELPRWAASRPVPDDAPVDGAAV